MKITYHFTPEKHLIIESCVNGVLEWRVRFINGCRSILFGELDERDEKELNEFYESGNLDELAKVF
jgi:hypothetical protein